jgi:2-oxoglutarate dehydrogenase E2 component (dihydrolipoamide succinyltransferase)
MIEVVMPQMGESLSEGTVVRWLKATGDAVKRDEPLFEISTDKVDSEVPSPAEGRLARILIGEGGRVAVGAAVALLELPHETTATQAAPTAAADASHFKASHAAQLVSFRRFERRPAAGPGAPGIRSFSPVVLARAQAGGIPLADLASLPGSGRGGRLTKKDVERFLHAGGRSVGRGGEAALGAVPPEYLYQPGPEDKLTPISPLRRKIAEQISWSIHISPQATAFAECDMSRAASLVTAAGNRFARTIGAPLTHAVLVARVLVAALREFPVLNASVVGENLVLKPRVHLGVALALADSDELVVPVIRGAEELTTIGLARALFEMTQRARARLLSPQDLQGATFTLTNPGSFGGITSTPMLFQPQVASLGLGAVAKRAVVVNDALAIRPVMTLSLTIDQRAADGSLAFRFLERLRQGLERIDDTEVPT